MTAHERILFGGFALSLILGVVGIYVESKVLAAIFVCWMHLYVVCVFLSWIRGRRH